MCPCFFSSLLTMSWFYSPSLVVCIWLGDIYLKYDIGWHIFEIWQFLCVSRLTTSDNLLVSIQEKIKWADNMSELDKKHRKDVEDRVEEVKKSLSLKVSWNKYCLNCCWWLITFSFYGKSIFIEKIIIQG